jgi:Flp pilus assembly protein TadG
MIGIERRGGRGRGFRRDDSGATAVEFALVAPLLCLALLSIVEIGMLGMMSSGLDNAVIESARRIRTGRTDGPTSAGVFKDQICARMGGSLSACRSRLTVSVQPYDHFTDANVSASAQPNGTFDKGGPGDIMLVKANYKWPLMTPFIATGFHRDGPMDVTLASRLAFKNEPYQ